MTFHARVVNLTAKIIQGKFRGDDDVVIDSEIMN
jgi:hypothetical protein